MKKEKITKKQLKFINAFDGDIKKAAEKAGYSYSYARALITKPHIVKAIKTREDKEKALDDEGLIATRKERQAFWSSVMRGEPQVIAIEEKDGKEEKIKAVPDMKNRIRAAELLGKSEGDFINIHEITDNREGVKKEITDEMDQKQASNIYFEMLKGQPSGSA